MFTPNESHKNNISKYMHLNMWGHFSSLYSRFNKVIVLESTNATSEGKMQVYF
jgi:hypothetical protein